MQEVIEERIVVTKGTRRQRGGQKREQGQEWEEERRGSGISVTHLPVLEEIERDLCILEHVNSHPSSFSRLTSQQ